MRLAIERDYTGQPLPRSDHGWFELVMEGELLRLEIDAPYFADPPPPRAAGSTERLWEYEVAELFIADAAERYLEIELGPHGHYLALELDGVRRVRQQGFSIEYEVRIERDDGAALGRPRGRYHGVARVAATHLPPHPVRVNAYLIHGTGADRCHHAHVPVASAGSQPDFHRLECFAAAVIPTSSW